LQETKNVNEINIFLAGNSSKSEIVMDIFNKYIKENNQKINMLTQREGEYFKLFPALGSRKAYELQEALGIRVNKDTVESITEKTGVAYGLVKCRKGSRIKVISKNINDDNEINFKYYKDIIRKIILKA
jgi:hypothetical protein